MAAKTKIATPWIVALVMATLDQGLRPALLFAADQTPQSPVAVKPAGDDRWQFNIVPYLWGAGLNGDVTIGRVEEEVDRLLLECARLCWLPNDDVRHSNGT